MTVMNDMRSVIEKWWRKELANDMDGTARGLSARLRRATTILEVLSEEAVHDLAHELGSGAFPERTAGLATVLAHVKEYGPETFARRCGEVTAEHGAGKDKMKSRLLSESRFQRIIRADDRMELAQLLRRALPIIGNKCKVGRLGEDFMIWNDQTKIRWLSEYFQSPPPTLLQIETQSVADEATP